MTLNTLWTIGHAGRDLATFLEALGEGRIKQVIDVRRHVVSRWKPAFSGRQLHDALAKEGIDYVHQRPAGNPFRKTMASNFGQGAALFDAYLDEHPDVVASLIEHAFSKRSALLCLCADAAQCHRSILVDRIRETRPTVKVVHLLKPEVDR